MSYKSRVTPHLIIKLN